MNKKVLAIIKSDQGNFLLLRTNPKHMQMDSWYVVTGSVKDNETDEVAVRREIQEETGLGIIDIRLTSLILEYEWPKDSGKMCSEKVFFVVVKEDKVKLSRWEHLEYKWLDKENFIKEIDWFDGKVELVKILKSF
jgi:8-oxo-dGTP pyrophosphatase MutT (NUDIX family)